eukprot:3878513-Amphidinium_carterae.1
MKLSGLDETHHSYTRVWQTAFLNCHETTKITLIYDSYDNKAPPPSKPPPPIMPEEMMQRRAQNTQGINRKQSIKPHDEIP